MMTSEDIAKTCTQLAQAVEITLDIKSSFEDRQRAYVSCEEFKETSPICAQCGFSLAQDSTASGAVRHFGLKLIEHFVKFRWNDLVLAEKVYVKENAMSLMAKGTRNLLTEEVHIKDALSRIVVEMIKREWPQNWPGLLGELNLLCQLGPTQTELVLFVFLRLAEDIAVLQTLQQSGRRKEIQQALNLNMKDIFIFFLNTLDKHYTGYVVTSKAMDVVAQEECKAHMMVSKKILEIFAVFSEWVAMPIIMENDAFLISVLCTLLDDDLFQSYAANCLLSIVSRKQDVGQNKCEFLRLFETKMITPMFSAIVTAANKPLDYEHYKFMKVMVRIVIELGNQVCTIFGKSNEISRVPDNFEMYLDAILSFNRHASQQLNFYSNELWMKLFSHGQLSKDKIVQGFVQKWIEASGLSCVKFGDPTLNNHPACAYNRLDFECDEEYRQFFGIYRMIILDIMKLFCSTHPDAVFNFVEMWLNNVLNKISDKEDYTSTSSIILELEGLSLMLDSVYSKLDNCDYLKKFLGRAFVMFQQTIRININNLTLLSVILSCISSQFYILKFSSNYLHETLEKIFYCITFKDPSENKNSALVCNLRRHGCALLIKLVIKFPTVLLQAFEYIHNTFKNIFLKLSKREIVSICEVLLILSNSFKNYAKQKFVINEVYQLVIDMQTNFNNVIQSADNFIEFVNLNKPAPTATSIDDKFYENQSYLGFHFSVLLAIAKRCNWPVCSLNENPLLNKDQNLKLEESKEYLGGFVVLDDSTKVPIIKNPATEFMIPNLSSIFALINTLNSLWLDDNSGKISQDYRKVLDMLEVDKNSILGITNTPPELDELSRRTLNPIQSKCHFFNELYDNCFHILTYCCYNLGYDFYACPNLNQLLFSLVQTSTHVPDFRFRSFIRTFLKSFVSKVSMPTCSCNCRLWVPAKISEYLLSIFCPYATTRLMAMWERLVTRTNAEGYDEDNTESNEVLENRVARQVTREYLDVLKVVFVVAPNKVEKLNGMTSETNGITELGEDLVNPFGVFIFRNSEIKQHVLMLLLNVLSWKDSHSSLKASLILETIFKNSVNENGPSDNFLKNDKFNLNINENEAVHIIFSIFKAFQYLGEYEGNRAALVNLCIVAYEKFCKDFSAVKTVFLQVPNCTEESLARFEMSFTESASIKSKRDSVKKIVEHLIGKNVSDLFNKQVIIKDLPALPSTKCEAKNTSLIDIEKNDLGLCNLFGS